MNRFSLPDAHSRIAAPLAVVALLAPLSSAVTVDSSHVIYLAVGWLITVLATIGVAAGLRADKAPIQLNALLLYLVAIGFLRHSEGGATSGYSPLLLLPLFWVALTQNRKMLWRFIAGLVLLLGIPILTFGAPEYPVGEWRRLAIWLSVAPVAGLATQRVVATARSATDELESLVRTDPLTRLQNRRGYMETLTREMARARRTAEPLSVAFLDLDFFKRFNDAHGHAGGDDLLRGAAVAWGRELRAVDVLTRWGGEEFVVVLPNCARPVAHQVLERMRAATPMEQTASIGLATWNGTEDGDALLARADAALYRAKENGRNRIEDAS